MKILDKLANESYYLAMGKTFLEPPQQRMKTSWISTKISNATPRKVPD